MSTVIYSTLYLCVVLFGYMRSRPKFASGLKLFLGVLAILAVVASLAPILASRKNYLEDGFWVPFLELGLCFFGGYIGGRVSSETMGKSIAALGFVAGVTVHFLLGRTLHIYGGQVVACESNLKNMSTALEMYSTDWSGNYPQEMSKLTPNYLRFIPECPAAGTVTYSYAEGLEAPGNTAGYEFYYFLSCEGDSHKAVGRNENFPQYNSIDGLTKNFGARPDTPWYEWYDTRTY